MGCLNLGTFSKHGYVGKDQMSRIVWCGPIIRMDILGRASVLQSPGPSEEPVGPLMPHVVSSELYGVQTATQSGGRTLFLLHVFLAHHLRISTVYFYDVHNVLVHQFMYIACK